MSASPFQDPRANDLLSRVSDDVSLLRQDIGNLLSHTTRHTLPAGMRGLADSAKTRLASGKLYTAEQLRVLRGQVNQPAAAWVGGALLFGVIAAGVYLFCSGKCDSLCEFDDADDEGE
ncbi:MAG: hypothetical protein WCS43_03990 [Verrucomicrobiota bacterium]